MEDTKIYDSKEFQSEYVSDVVKDVATILEDRGYNPVNQIVGYLMSGDPGYISSYKEARSKLTSLDRTKILETLVEEFLNNK
ncbi:MAG: IreB family regulatory phosphoprotein [Bacilli bacterium]|nr:IreB family regulatory phosphoprotein [Bacilli bacterium]